jgi:hypothetical protein
MGKPSIRSRKRVAFPSDAFFVEIVLPDFSTTSAVVVDLSTESARLVVPARFTLPREFELRLDRRTYFVRLVKHWRRSVIVEFRGCQREESWH